MNEISTSATVVSAEEIVALMPEPYVHVAREAVLVTLPTGYKVEVEGMVVHLFSPKLVTLPSLTGPIEVPEHIARIHYCPEHTVLAYDSEPLGEYVQRPAEWVHIGGPLTNEGWPTLQAAIDALLAP